MYKCYTCKFTSERQLEFDKHMKSVKHNKAMKENNEKWRKECEYIQNPNKANHHTHLQQEETKPKTILQDMYINNYGSERTDYMLDDFIKIIKSSRYLAVSKYVQLKHFILEYPENHNVVYENDKYYIKIDDKWQFIDKEDLENKLYYDNKKDIHNQLEELKEKIQHNPDLGISLHEIEEFEKYLNPTYRLPILPL